jgi:hypothetical protein
MATTPAAGAALLDTLGDFTLRDNWDKFFALRGTGDSFEWYAEWPPLEASLLELLRGSGAGEALEILVPGCGSSVLSEELYDAGFRRITNVDFSRVVVADMLGRHARARPEMRWRVMDMTEMQVRPVKSTVSRGSMGWLIWSLVFVFIVNCLSGAKFRPSIN